MCEGSEWWVAVCLSCRISQTVNLHLIRGRRKSNIGSWRTLELWPAIYVRGVSGLVVVCLSCRISQIVIVHLIRRRPKSIIG